MENNQQQELKKEAATFLGLVLLIAVAVGYHAVTDNRTVNTQTTCQVSEDELLSLPFSELQNLMQYHVQLEQYEEAAKLRDLMRKKFGTS